MSILNLKFFSEQYEGIYEILNQYTIRSITFNGLDETIAERIIKLRPMPSNFIIFASPSEMPTMLENVTDFFFSSKIHFFTNFI